MTMVNPSQKLSKQHFHTNDFGSYYESFVHMSSRLEAEAEEEERGYEYNYYRHTSQLKDCLLGSDLPFVTPMAEDESRTESVNEADSSSKENNGHENTINVNQEREKDKEEEEEEDGWLQLGIGSGSHEKKPPSGRLGLVELDLLPPPGRPGDGGGTSTSTSSVGALLTAPTVQHIFSHHPYQVPEFRLPPPPPPPLSQYISTASLFLHQYPGAGTSTSIYPQHIPQEINWAAFRPMGSPSSNVLPIATAPTGSHFSVGPFPGLHGGISGSLTEPSRDFRVIDPPRRPHSGLWFSLQASLNQAKEPYLHQISKSYLRIKDGRMTIRLVLKYLVNKLQLENESEVEIRCRGQELQPYLTLQHVRDHIWRTTNAGDNTSLTLLPSQSSSTTTSPNHVMVLHYGRSP